ncbi:hypothetical protein, partial [Treponema sp. R80B11-R83G3]
MRLLKYVTKKRLIIGGGIIFLLLAFIFSLPRPLFNYPYSPVLFDNEGNLLGAQVASDGQWRF